MRQPPWSTHLIGTTIWVTAASVITNAGGYITNTSAFEQIARRIAGRWFGTLATLRVRSAQRTTNGHTAMKIPQIRRQFLLLPCVSFRRIDEIIGIGPSSCQAHGHQHCKEKQELRVPLYHILTEMPPQSVDKKLVKVVFTIAVSLALIMFVVSTRHSTQIQFATNIKQRSLLCEAIETDGGTDGHRLFTASVAETLFHSTAALAKISLSVCSLCCCCCAMFESE